MPATRATLPSPASLPKELVPCAVQVAADTTYLYKVLHSILDHLHNDTETVSAMNQKLAARMQELEETAANSNAALAEVTARLESVEEDNAKLKNAMQRLETVAESRAELGNQLQRLEAVEDDNTNLKEALKRLEAVGEDNAKLKEALQRLEGQGCVTRLGEKVDAVAEQVADNQGRQQTLVSLLYDVFALQPDQVSQAVQADHKASLLMRQPPLPQYTAAEQQKGHDSNSSTPAVETSPLQSDDSMRRVRLLLDTPALASLADRIDTLEESWRQQKKQPLPVGTVNVADAVLDLQRRLHRQEEEGEARLAGLAQELQRLRPELQLQHQPKRSVQFDNGPATPPTDVATTDGLQQQLDTLRQQAADLEDATTAHARALEYLQDRKLDSEDTQMAVIKESLCLLEERLNGLGSDGGEAAGMSSKQLQDLSGKLHGVQTQLARLDKNKANRSELHKVDKTARELLSSRESVTTGVVPSGADTNAAFLRFRCLSCHWPAERIEDGSLPKPDKPFPPGPVLVSPSARTYFEWARVPTPKAGLPSQSHTPATSRSESPSKAVAERDGSPAPSPPGSLRRMVRARLLGSDKRVYQGGVVAEDKAQGNSPNHHPHQVHHDTVAG